MRRLAFRIPVLEIVICWLALCGGLSAQQGLTPEAALARVLKETPAHPEWFAASFLAQVPTAQIDQIVKQYTAQYGAFQRADGSAPSFTVYLERGSFPARIALNADGQITGLWFGLAEPLKAASLDEGMTAFAKLPGKVSVTVQEEGKQRASLHPDEALAVGSTFKLAILAALLEQAGKHPAEQVIPLRAEWKAVPSGVLQTWPDGTPLTIATYEAEMISISDNTAADSLLSIAGRENVEHFAPRNRPFLSVREATTLKARSNAALLARYRAADEAGRRQVVTELDRLPLPGMDEIEAFASAPVAAEVEWYFTVGELCGLAMRAADAPAMRINPGLAKPAEWQQIAFKGGSEGGVLNLTTALTGKNGRHYCVSATWNNHAAVSEADFFGPYGGVLSTLAKESAAR